ncbi:MAG: nucleotidyltransferase domain-containing protein [Candidatus Pacearchaeota archaeon]|jgi:predicted nucleotidyltransferase
MKIKRNQEEGFSAIFGDLEISHLEGTIIASFFPEAEQMTIKEIKERINYSYERVNSALKSLKEKGIVIENQKGKTLLYSLDLKNRVSYSLGYNRYTLQKEIHFIKKYKIIYKAIQEIENNPFVFNLILFGSYSKGNETKQSDIDLLITCLPSNEKEIENFVKSLKHKYEFNFSPIVFPINKFPDIKKDNPELWNDLKIYAIAFKGTDNFYYWMYQNEEP